MAEQVQKQDLYIYCLQETHFRSKDTHRLNVRGGKRYSMQMEIKRKLGQQYLYQTKQALKYWYRIQGRTLHNDKEINPRIRYNNCKYICTQHKSTQIHKVNINNVKGEIDRNTIIVGDFNTPFTSMDRSQTENQ